MKRDSSDNEQQGDQQQEQDIYAVLSYADPIEMNDSIMNEISMNMFSDMLTHPLSKNISNHTSPFPTPTSTSNEFNFNQGKNNKTKISHPPKFFKIKRLHELREQHAV
jgi:predicted alpha/beta-fold hydrolase